MDGPCGQVTGPLKWEPSRSNIQRKGKEKGKEKGREGKGKDKGKERKREKRGKGKGKERKKGEHLEKNIYIVNRGKTAHF